MDEQKPIAYGWRDIFRAFKMAFDPKIIFLGYIGFLTSLLWCVIAVTLFYALKLVDTSPYMLIKFVLSPAGRVISAMLSVITPLEIGEFFAVGIVAIGLLAIWSLVGGAITRIAAIDYAKDESIRLVDALKFARNKFWSYFWSPLVPVIGVIFFAICNVIEGLLGRIPVFGEILVALGFPFALISGFLMVFIGVVGAFGLTFMFPTISAEGSDAFDAMSRAYSYILSRPKLFASYLCITILFGFVSLLMVTFGAWLMIRLSFFTVGLGMGQKFSLAQSFVLQECTISCLGFFGATATDAVTTAITPNWALRFLVYMLLAYVFLIKAFIWTFIITFVFSAKTIMYFLLRKEIDSTDVTDVYLEEKEREFKGVKKEMSEKTDKPAFSQAGDNK